MNTCKYLALVLIIVSAVSCKRKTTANINRKTKADSPAVGVSAIKPDTPGNKPVPLAQLIVPGISMGQTAINETSESIHKKLGKPDGGDAAMGKSVSIWYANHDTASYVTQMYFARGAGDDEVKHLKQIRVTSPFFKVDKNIYTGQPLKNAMALFKLIKTATFENKGQTITLYDDSKAGIAFEADNKGICNGITVHAPGREVTGTYLPFFPDLKILK